jgi:mono/diheme cytochrome c family protein
MKKLLTASLILATSTILLATPTAEDLAVKHCGECHLMGKITKAKLKKMKAPPYWALAKMAKQKYTSKEDMIKYIVDYAQNPAEEKMLFPHETRDRFGVMPSQKKKVTEAQIRKISEYILGNIK